MLLSCPVHSKYSICDCQIHKFSRKRMGKCRQNRKPLSHIKDWMHLDQEITTQNIKSLHSSISHRCFLASYSPNSCFHIATDMVASIICTNRNLSCIKKVLLEYSLHLTFWGTTRKHFRSDEWLKHQMSAFKND